MGEVQNRPGTSTKRNPLVRLPHFLDEVDEGEYLATLRNLLAAKRKSIRAKSEYELNGKLIRFALSRGFEMKDIRCCIDVSDENGYPE